MAALSRTAPTDADLCPLLRRDEVAELLGVDPRTVRWYTETGRLPAVRLGRRTTRYRAQDVAALIDDSLSTSTVESQRPDGRAEALGKTSEAPAGSPGLRESAAGQGRHVQE